MQHNIGKWQIWVDKWQMEFHLCKVLHFRTSNARGKYTVSGRNLEEH